MINLTVSGVYLTRDGQAVKVQQQVSGYGGRHYNNFVGEIKATWGADGRTSRSVEYPHDLVTEIDPSDPRAAQTLVDYIHSALGRRILSHAWETKPMTTPTRAAGLS